MISQLTAPATCQLEREVVFVRGIFFFFIFFWMGIYFNRKDLDRINFVKIDMI